MIREPMEIFSEYDSTTNIYTVRLTGSVTPDHIRHIVRAVNGALSRRSDSMLLIDVKQTQVSKSELPNIGKVLDLGSQLLPMAIPGFTRFAFLVPNLNHRIRFAEQLVDSLNQNGVLAAYFLSSSAARKWLAG